MSWLYLYYILVIRAIIAQGLDIIQRVVERSTVTKIVVTGLFTYCASTYLPVVQSYIVYFSRYQIWKRVKITWKELHMYTTQIFNEVIDIIRPFITLSSSSSERFGFFFLFHFSKTAYLFYRKMTWIYSYHILSQILITNLEKNGLKFLEAENILRLKFLEAESVSRP